MKASGVSRCAIFFAFALLVAACQRPANAPQGANASAVVSDFFSSYQGNFRIADDQSLSSGLKKALSSIAEGETISAARMKAGEFPTDKPLILEGEVFSGLYEGFTGYEVIGESISGKQAVVQVRFRNEPYDVTWTDEVLLVDENGWKIDDVRYAQKMAGLLSLREVLREFQRTLETETANASATQTP